MRNDKIIKVSAQYILILLNAYCHLNLFRTQVIPESDGIWKPPPIISVADAYALCTRKHTTEVNDRELAAGKARGASSVAVIAILNASKT